MGEKAHLGEKSSSSRSRLARFPGARCAYMVRVEHGGSGAEASVSHAIDLRVRPPQRGLPTQGPQCGQRGGIAMGTIERSGRMGSESNEPQEQAIGEREGTVSLQCLTV